MIESLVRFAEGLTLNVVLLYLLISERRESEREREQYREDIREFWRSQK